MSVPKSAGWLVAVGVFVAMGSVRGVCQAEGTRDVHVVPDQYGSRAEGRAGLPAKTRRAILSGLEWLEAHQDDDGKWDADEFMKHDQKGKPSDGFGSAVHDVGITGLALLAFLGDGSTTSSGPYRDVVTKATGWLMAQQADGMYGANAAHEFIYSHAIATLAICEAYGLSGDPELRDSAQAGIDYLERHRNPTGAWRYQPRANDNDTSVTGWCVAAYKTAQDFGLNVNPTGMRRAGFWLDQVTDDAGQVGYTRKNELSARHPGSHGKQFPPDKGESLTAVGLHSRFLLGQETSRVAAIEGAVTLILAKPPLWDEDDGTIDHYYWYHASNALRRVGGKLWSAWYEDLSDILLKNQRSDGNFEGSWDPVGAWGEDGGRVYSTAMLVLCLEAGYRHASGAMLIPSDSQFRKLRNLWEKADYAGVARELGDLEEEADAEQQPAISRVEEMLTAEVAYATSLVTYLHSLTDYLVAFERLEEIRDNFGDLEPGEAAKLELDSFSSNKEIQREIAASRALRTLLNRYDPANPRVKSTLKTQLELLLRRYGGTQAGSRAQEILTELERRERGAG